MNISFYSSPALKLILKSLTRARANKKKIVLATGVFDLLHQEHLNYLQAAKKAGDFLVVAVESDVRVRKIKGEGRPIQSQEKRVSVIRALPYVDLAFVLPESFSTPEDRDLFMQKIRPNIYACSSHSEHLESKKALVEKYGGTLAVVLEHNPAISTTNFLSQLNR